MNIEKIEINGHYVWVDADAKIKEDCYALHLGVLGEREIVMANGECKLDKKIIAASPELNLEGVPAYVEWLAEQEYPEVLSISKTTDPNFIKKRNSFIKGYQTAEKELPTWDDVRKAIEMAGMTFTDKDYSYQWTTEEIIEMLKQSKVAQSK